MYGGLDEIFQKWRGRKTFSPNKMNHHLINILLLMIKDVVMVKDFQGVVPSFHTTQRRSLEVLRH